MTKRPLRLLMEMALTNIILFLNIVSYVTFHQTRIKEAILYTYMNKAGTWNEIKATDICILSPHFLKKKSA
jgi:hypothetical protein